MMTLVNQTRKIREILIELIELLTRERVIDDYNGLRVLLRDVDYLLENPDDPEVIGDMKSDIHTMYGGMGTFQDLALGGRSGKITEEDKTLNRKLDYLRDQLYNLVDQL